MRKIYLNDRVFDRLDKIATAKCMKVHTLAEIYLELAACFEEVQSHSMAVSVLEDVLTNLIENGAKTA